MKRRHLPVLVVAVLAFLCTAGCVPRPSMYYWGDYSETLYRAKKTPGDDTLLAHRQSLENIVEQSKTLNLRVPPGVYAELGYIYFRQNNDGLASRYFQMEENLYPESKILMTRLKQAVALRKEKAAKKPDAAVPAPPKAEAKTGKAPEVKTDRPAAKPDATEAEGKKNE
jgi:hypothetical protein